MPTSAHIYARTVILIGIIVLACAAIGWQSPNGPAFLACLGLTCLAATLKLNLPKLTGTLSPAFVFVLVAVATRSWSETVVIAAISGLVQCIWKPKVRPTWLQIAFNTSTMAISSAVAYGIARILLSAGAAEALPVVLGAAGVALLLCNTLLLSTILCLIQEAPFMNVWRSVQLWTVPYYLAGGVLANIWGHAEFSASIGLTILAAGSVYSLSVCYREAGRLIAQLEEAKRYAI